MFVKGSSTGSSSINWRGPATLLISLYLYQHGHVGSVLNIGNVNLIFTLVTEYC